MKKLSNLNMKKSSMIKFIRKIDYRKYLSIRNFMENHPFVKENMLFFRIIFVLLIILIIAISCFYTAFLSEEKVTTYFDLSEGNGNFRLTPDSFMRILYFPQKEDEMLLNLGFRNLGEDESAGFTFSYDERMKKKDDSFPEIFGVREILVKKEKDYTTRYYEIDFQEFETPRLIQKFSCRFFKDKLGDIELELHIYSSGDIFDDISLELLGSDLNFVSSFPKPDREFSSGIEYAYRPDDESFLYGILLKGYNPEIEKKFRVHYFIFGVLIAILSSLLATITFEILKEYARKVQARS